MTSSVSSVRTLSRGAVAAAVGALALAGCVNYFGIKSDKQIAPAGQFETTQSLPGEGGQWPSLAWANQFGDPQLPKLIAEALEGSPTIAQAQARIAKAQSFIESSRSALFPKAEGSYSLTRERFSGNAIIPPPFGGIWATENNALASASWDLDLWGKNRQRPDAAVSQEKAAAADLHQVRITLASSVARTYNQLAQLYALRDIAAREIENRKNVSTITNGRVQAGLDTNVEKQTALGDIAPSRTSTGRSRSCAISSPHCSARGRTAGCRSRSLCSRRAAPSRCPTTCPPTWCRAGRTSWRRAGKSKPRCTT